MIGNMDAQGIIIVEDDREIRSLLTDYLAREGFRVTACEDGAAMDRALEAAAANGRPFDLAILDIMLPGEDGLSLCRRLRAARGPAILMLTARRDEVDRIVGLEIGADDYLCKPFNPRELLARIRAILRRTVPDAAPDLPPRRIRRVAGLTVDLDARATTADGHAVDLTTAEFDLLVCFLERPQRVLTRDLLLDLTRGRDRDPFDRTIDVTVSRLRAKLGAALPEGARLIVTVRNVGYMLVAPVEA